MPPTLPSAFVWSFWFGLLGTLLMLAGCKHVVTRDYSFLGINHGFTEPHATIADRR